MNNVRIAVVGASIRSTMLFDFLNRNPDAGTITAVYDITPERGKYLINRYDAKKAVNFNTLSEAVENENVDAVFVGTPDYLHVEPVKSALMAGKHVFCEKPIATTIEDCDEIIQVARKTSSVFYVGKNLRHGPVHKKMHDILSSGKLGKLLTIEANEYYYGGRTYFRRWNRLRKFGGGLWITKACHDFDLLNWFAGGKPKKVSALSSLSYYKPIEGAGPNCRICKIKETCPDFYDVNDPEKSDWFKDWDELARITEQETHQPRDLCLYTSDKDTFDNGIALVEYDNDIRATYTVNVVSARSTRQLRLMGTEGSAEGDMEEGKVTYWKRYSDEKETFDLTDQMNSSHGGADDKIIKDFLDCCKSNSKPVSSWAEGRLALEVGLAARESCDNGTIVKL